MDTWKYDCRMWYPEEGCTFLGNGFIGGTIPRDGHGAGENPFTATAAAFYVNEQEDAGNLPHWLNTALKVGGESLRPWWIKFRQVLDLQAGTINTAYTSEDGSVRVETETFCHRALKNVCAYRLIVQALKPVELEIEPHLDLRRCTPKPTATPLAGVCGWELNYGDAQNQAAQILHAECSNGSVPAVFGGAESIGQRFVARLKSGDRCTLTVLVVTTTGATPAAEAKQSMLSAAATRYETLRRSHLAAMAELWAPCQIEIGNPFLERKARASMFYLLSGYREDVVHGGTATGLSSHSSWNGSVFWDTEFYMFPALLLFYPALARNTLMYRYATLGQAQRNAKALGECGARFAWQSKKTGKPFAGPFEDERHVSSDVAYCAWWYAHSTGDREFLKRQGREIILEVARNWAGRAIYNKPADRYEIHGVIPPDEHVWDHHVGQPINNSAMTNIYARWVLAQAAALATEIPADERRHWQEIAEKMFLPRDEKLKIYAEYEGYNGHPLKQADIAHVFFPLTTTIDPEEIRRTSYYYLDREQETGLFLTHSPSVYAAALSKAGDVRGVERCLELAARNFAGPFELPRESNYGGGAVVTGAGSFLNLLSYGVLGIDNCGERLTAHPCVPPQVGAIKMSGVQFQGKRYAVSAAPSVSARIDEL